MSLLRAIPTVSSLIMYPALEWSFLVMSWSSSSGVVSIETTNSHGDKFLTGSADVKQPTTVYVFTGQGSQEPGMGVDLDNSSPAARAVWDGADTHLLVPYGFSVTGIVRGNPKEKTIYSGGSKVKLSVNSIWIWHATPRTRRIMLRHSLSLLTWTTALPATLLTILPVFFLPLNSLKSLSSSPRRPLSRTCVPKGLSRRGTLSPAILWVNILPSLPMLMSSIYLLLSMSSSTAVLLCSVLLNAIFKTVQIMLCVLWIPSVFPVTSIHTPVPSPYSTSPANIPTPSVPAVGP